MVQIGPMSSVELEALKDMTHEFRFDLQKLDSVQAERITSIRQKIRETQDLIKTLKVSRERSGGHGKANLLRLGMPIPAPHIDLDWTRDDDDTTVTTIDEGGDGLEVMIGEQARNLLIIASPTNILLATAEAEKELVDLQSRFHHEFVMFLKNEHAMNGFAMNAGLDVDEIGQWVGTNPNIETFESYRTQFTIPEAVTANSYFMLNKVTQAIRKEPQVVKDAPDTSRNEAQDEFYLRELAAALDYKDPNTAIQAAKEAEISKTSGDTHHEAGPKNFAELEAASPVGSPSFIDETSSLADIENGTSSIGGGCDTDDGQPPFCTHCKKVGHANEWCWELHPDEKPIWAKTPCGHCGKMGHKKDRCFKLYPELRRGIPLERQRWAQNLYGGKLGF
jgi:hypothetical protein